MEALARVDAAMDEDLAVYRYIGSGELAELAKCQAEKPPAPSIFCLETVLPAVRRCPAGLVRLARWLTRQDDAAIWLRLVCAWIGCIVGPRATERGMVRAIKRRRQ